MNPGTHEDLEPLLREAGWSVYEVPSYVHAKYWIMPNPVEPAHWPADKLQPLLELAGLNVERWTGADRRGFFMIH